MHLCPNCLLGMATFEPRTIMVSNADNTHYVFVEGVPAHCCTMCPEETFCRPIRTAVCEALEALHPLIRQFPYVLVPPGIIHVEHPI